MANWFIQRPQEHSDASEIRVAEQLRELDDQWTVIWGFYYTDKKGQQREGDFVVIGPAGGALVLEVKTSLPRWFGPTGKWEGQDENPIDQLMAEWSAVVKMVQAEELRTFIAKALCVPGESAPVEDDRVKGIQRSLLVLGNDLADWLPKVWIRIFQNKVRFPVPTSDRDRLLKRFGVAVGSNVARGFLDHTEELFHRQLTQRFTLLDQLSDNRQILVRGGTGTGKTWHALEQAFRYASKGHEVLFLVYNLALTSQLQHLVNLRQSGPGTVTVMGWEELFIQLASADKEITVPEEAGELHHFYEVLLPGKVRQLAADSKSRSKWPQFDALVVDEGQDHDTNWDDEDSSEGWWDTYRSLLRLGKHAPASIFYDPAQRPPFRNPKRFVCQALIEGWSQPALVRLQPALRYTRPLWEFFNSHPHPAINGMVEALGRGDQLPEGPEPEIVRAGKKEEAHSVVEEIIVRWLKEGLCKPEEILILHKESEIDRSLLGASQSLAGHPLSHVIAQRDQSIRHTSINKAKGLDSRAVIMIGCETITDQTSDFDAYNWFMGVSRARQLLALVETEPAS